MKSLFISVVQTGRYYGAAFNSLNGSDNTNRSLNLDERDARTTGKSMDCFLIFAGINRCQLVGAL